MWGDIGRYREMNGRRHARRGKPPHLVRARARARAGIRVTVGVRVALTLARQAPAPLQARCVQLEAFSLTLACVTHALGAARMDSGLSSRSLDLPG